MSRRETHSHEVRAEAPLTSRLERQVSYGPNHCPEEDSSGRRCVHERGHEGDHRFGSHVEQVP